MSEQIKVISQRLAYVTELFYKVRADHLEWRKSQRGRSYLKKHPISNKEILETLNGRKCNK